ncbi:probable maltase-glucoamylase 2 [Morone saxatilis]|uniref:probable maltase-glucoamylase 2 n=1 Tax=Morone saxatilis TaxID=34816 RepID=UPI0015E1BF25|nr:probable maltase-glucoamylase 2 [Morone saxatilis]
MARKFISWMFVLGYLHASSGQTTTSEDMGTFEPLILNMTAPPLNATAPTTTTEAFLDSLAHLKAKLTSYGEVTNEDIIKFVKQFFRDNLPNGTAHAVTLTEIQRIVDSTTAGTTVIPTTIPPSTAATPMMLINTTTTPTTPLTPTPLNATTPVTPTTIDTTTPVTPTTIDTTILDTSTATLVADTTAPLSNSTTVSSNTTTP